MRIPKGLLEEAGLAGEVEISARKGSLTLTAVRAPHAGWDEAFRTMAEAGDDRPVDGAGPLQSSFDAGEWQWT